MKQILLILLLIPFITFANVIEISTLKSTNETKYVTYSVEKGESINDIAKKFSLKTVTLLKFNNMTLNSNLKTFQTILIPLTETNYFKLKGINATAGYLPVYFVVDEPKTKIELCTQLGILVESFDKWNKSEYIDNMIVGEKVIVGWLKTGAAIVDEEPIAKEPIKIIRKETIKEEVVKTDTKAKQTEQEITSRKAGNYIAEIKKKDVSIEEIKGENNKTTFFKKKKINSIDETELNEDEENATSDTTKKVSVKQKFNKLFKSNGYKPYEKKNTVATPVKTNKNLVVAPQNARPKYVQPTSTTYPTSVNAKVKKEPFSFKKIFKKNSYEPYQKKAIQPTVKPTVVAKKKEIETPVQPNYEVVKTKKEPFSFKKLFKGNSYEPYQKKAPKPIVKVAPKKQVETSITYEIKEEVKTEEPTKNTQKTEPVHFFTKIKNAFKTGGYKPYNKNNSNPTTVTKPVVKQTPIVNNNYKPIVRKTVEVPKKKTPIIEPKIEQVVVKTYTPKVEKIKPTKEVKSVEIDRPKTEKNNFFTRVKKSFSTNDNNPKPVIKNNTPLKKEVNPTNIKEEEIKDELVETDNTIRNEIKTLNLTNSKNGKASMFYSGPKSGKFYVVTNIAPKGEMVKVTNTSNGKFVMAEVLSSLPSSDISKGLLIKLSDNAKLPLNVNNSTFFVKVNY